MHHKENLNSLPFPQKSSTRPKLKYEYWNKPDDHKAFRKWLSCKDWRRMDLDLRNLIKTHDLRAKIGKYARNMILKQHSLEVMEGKYLSILNKLTFKKN